MKRPHLCVSSSELLSDGMSWMFSHSKDSPSWQTRGSYLSTAMTAGRRQIFQLPLQHLKERERSHITSAHVKKLFSLKLLMQHKAKHVNTTPVCFILLNLTECWQFMYFLVILLNYFIFPIVVFKQHMVPLYRTELDKKRNSCVSSWFDFFFCFIPIKYFLILKKKKPHKNFSFLVFFPRKVSPPFLPLLDC